ncbi:MAG: HDIG domain-containing metalloprotein [Parachlamydiales bacterium]|jgi:hypothetical protein
MDNPDSNARSFNLAFYKNFLFKNDLVFRLLIGLIGLVCLFLFIHFREVQVDALELGSKASSYVVAQLDFDFPDEEATFFLKQEALKDLGPIFTLDDRKIAQVRYDFEYYLIHDNLWKEKLKETSLEDLYKETDALVSFLKRLRFADVLTLKKMKKFNIQVSDFMVFTPAKEEKEILLPPEYWQRLEELFLKQQVFPQAEADFVLSFFAEKEWFLQLDGRIEKSVRSIIENSIPQKYTEIKAGTRIIAGGEKVTSRHIAMLSAMKKAVSEKRSLLSFPSIVGNLIISLVFIVLTAMYLRIDQSRVLASLQKLSLLVCTMILTLAFAKVTEYVLLQNASPLEAVRYPLIVPFAAFLLSILFNSRLALFGSTFLAILLSITLIVDHTQFLVINLTAALIVIVSSASLKKRKEVFQVGGKCLLGIIPVILAFNFLTKNFWSLALLQDIGLSALFMLIISVLVMGMLPILESLFNVLTDITLMEYTDPSSELLKRLALEMPGTYQHSLVLGNIAEALASAIGANALLCRVATLYHDIGKLANAHFFTENQTLDVNIHQLLTPAESAQVIISHVKDGVAIAKKYHLPQPFIDVIQEHHGTMLVYYFYHQELERQMGDKAKINEALFRYLGPKPKSKESAIIMLADGVEAASRSLEKTGEEALRGLIDKVVKDRVDDDQLNECNLTFAELMTIKKTLLKVLLVSHHVRIKYPEKKA